MPRFAFEKFPEADATLTTQMKSVGETMAIGRTFRESFQKAMRGLEVGAFGLGSDNRDVWGTEAQPDAGRNQGQAQHTRRGTDLLHSLCHEVGHDDRRDLCSDEHRCLVPRSPGPNHRGRKSTDRNRFARCDDQRRHVASEARRVLRSPNRQDHFDHGIEGPREAFGIRDSAGLQKRRYLCGGVRGLHAVLLQHLRSRR